MVGPCINNFSTLSISENFSSILELISVETVESCQMLLGGKVYQEKYENNQKVKKQVMKLSEREQ